jgi:hypothetical protein
MSLYTIVENVIPEKILKKRNAKKDWAYGYNSEYDIVIVSKDGTIGDIYDIQHLKIAIPATPSKIDYKHNKWEVEELPKELSRIRTQFDWNRRDSAFKSQWVDYIEEQFNRRELGFWFINNKMPTYMTGSHYMYLQFTKTDVGKPDFREANRIFFLFWEACKADNRCFGMCYLKNRRSGFSYMASSEVINIATLSRDSSLGIMSKTGTDAKMMFTGKVVPIINNYPFFFMPTRDGNSSPVTELAFRVPSSKITRKNMDKEEEEEIDGLDTTITWKNTADNSFDGQKLKLLVEDEAAKLEKPLSILNGWRVRKTCLRLGSRIIGKCMMGSTSNALDKGGENYKKIYYDSDVRKRNANGQTKSGLYALFIEMGYNYEGYIDEFGHAVLEDPETPVNSAQKGEVITDGVITNWQNEVDSLKGDPDALNEFYRQFPRTESHAFRDETKSSLFNLTKIYEQIDFNDGMIKDRVLTKGFFHWKNGEKDTEVIWTPDRNGRFLVSWIPEPHMRNNYINKNGVKHPMNENIGAFGVDSYDISGAITGGSNGALHGLTKFNMSNAPSNVFFLEYIARPQTAEIFYEEVLMACVFYGMPILVENNKPRLLYHFKNRGYRGFCMNRPDKPYVKLSITERELGGIPNSSEDIKQAHATAIESYIEKYVGYDAEGTYRDPQEMGDMPFNRTLQDWAKFDINDRTKHDASISSGLAIMANQKHVYMPEKKESKISIKFAKYDNTGSTSRIIKQYE